VSKRRQIARREHRLWGDYIEAGSWPWSRGDNGEIEIKGRARRTWSGRGRADAHAVACTLDNEVFRVEASQLKAAAGLRPDSGRFSERPRQLVTVLATQAEGQTL